MTDGGNEVADVGPEPQSTNDTDRAASADVRPANPIVHARRIRRVVAEAVEVVLRVVAEREQVRELEPGRINPTHLRVDAAVRLRRDRGRHIDICPVEMPSISGASGEPAAL